MIVEAKDLDQGIRVLTLNRPPANAISAELIDELQEQCRAARETDAVKAVIVTGAGKFFSGGLDIKEASSGRSRLGDLGRGDGLFDLWTLPKPTVAMVGGHAIAGGAVIALACDFRITHEGDHKLGLNEVAIGLCFPIGPFEIVRLAMSNRQARYGMLGAGLYSVNRARELGFVDEVVSAAHLEPRCIEIAKGLAANGRLAYAHTKRYLQYEAVQRVNAQTPERLEEIRAIGRADETRARLATQVSAISRK